MRVQWVKLHGYWVLWEFIFTDRFIRCPLVTALSRVVYHNVGIQSERVLKPRDSSVHLLPAVSN